MEQYFAMTDTEDVVYLGQHNSFHDADEQAPGNSHWIFTKATLQQFVSSATWVIFEASKATQA